MRFSIITPTHKRRDSLERAIQSVLAQTYTNWEMVIVNDSPTDPTYQNFVINDPRIHYHKNEINRGVNYSRNYALDHVSTESNWIIFLDDDDYFAPDTLQTFHTLILTHAKQRWFVTNRALKNGTSLTQFGDDEKTYSYMWPYLISKKLKGDATHCIETNLITHNKITFSTMVKQAEEWFFFYQVGLHTDMYYFDHNSTISDGYDTQSGLNFRKQQLDKYYTSLITIFYEIKSKKILSPFVLIYFLLRIIRPIIRL
ncbi:MAG: hypothetical protein RLZZ308_125 [Candidatus Parcubacteria bacterium]|jgi:glycosyltransferase involved in cell wall biosynthesis